MKDLFILWVIISLLLTSEVEEPRYQGNWPRGCPSFNMKRFHNGDIKHRSCACTTTHEKGTRETIHNHPPTLPSIGTAHLPPFDSPLIHLTHLIHTLWLQIMFLKYPSFWNISSLREVFRFILLWRTSSNCELIRRLFLFLLATYPQFWMWKLLHLQIVVHLISTEKRSVHSWDSYKKYQWYNSLSWVECFLCSCFYSEFPPI